MVKHKRFFSLVNQLFVEDVEHFKERCIIWNVLHLADVKVTFVYDKDMNVEDINLDKVYTLGETMTKAAMNTAMGMGTVFVMLIIISLIISCFTLINKAQKKAENKKAANAPASAVSVAAPVVEAPQTDDLELVAVIAAAIAAATGSSTDDFVVRSIKRR